MNKSQKLLDSSIFFESMSVSVRFIVFVIVTEIAALEDLLCKRRCLVLRSEGMPVRQMV